MGEHKKTIFIIPGYTEQATQTQYQPLCNFFEENQYLVQKPEITWKYRTMSDYVSYFTDFYVQHKTDYNDVLGFSFGAMIAFISAPQLQPDSLYLCSLSPYFRDDLPGLKKTWLKQIGRRRVEHFRTLDAKQLGRKIDMPTTIFCGDKEDKSVMKRCTQTSQEVPNAKLVVVKDAPHDIGHPNYTKTVIDAVAL